MYIVKTSRLEGGAHGCASVVSSDMVGGNLGYEKEQEEGRGMGEREGDM